MIDTQMSRYDLFIVEYLKKNVFSGEMGLKLNIVQDEMLSGWGYTGITARLSIGKNRIAWLRRGNYQAILLQILWNLIIEIQLIVQR
jgi:hypothetical protein